MTGRAGRLEWWAQSFGTVFAFTMAMKALAATGQMAVQILVAIPCVFLASWLLWAVTFRRLHDLDRPAMEIWKIMIPIANFVLFAELAGKEGTLGENRYGPS